MSNQEMVRQLRENGYLRSLAVEKAMVSVDRAGFVPGFANPYDDCPQPIGYGQTISAPSVVAFMLDELQVEEGMNVLEIGTGSGYNTAILSRLAGKTGKVVTFEIVPELAALAEKHLSTIAMEKNIEFHAGDGSSGCLEKAPFDRIIVTAGMPFPKESHPLIQQLKPDGKLVAPAGGKFFQDIVVFDKKANSYRSVLPVMFVPLMGKDGFR